MRIARDKPALPVASAWPAEIPRATSLKRPGPPTGPVMALPVGGPRSARPRRTCGASARAVLAFPRWAPEPLLAAGASKPWARSSGALARAVRPARTRCGASSAGLSSLARPKARPAPQPLASGLGWTPSLGWARCTTARTMGPCLTVGAAAWPRALGAVSLEAGSVTPSGARPTSTC